MISRLGVTGVRDRLPEDVGELMARVRACADLPVALGFGIAHPEQVAEACRVADAAVVGSALVNVVAEHAASSNVCEQASEYVRWLKNESVDGLAELRQKIDALDEALVRLLNARAACALEIGRVKKHAGLPVYQPSREAEVLGHVQAINPGPLDDGAVRRLFERIIDEARRLERIAEADWQSTESHRRRGRMSKARRPWGPAGNAVKEYEDLMVVVMKERANDEQVQRVIAQLVEMGFDVHRSTGALEDRDRRRRRQPAVRSSADRGDGRRPGSAPDHRALQARQPQFPAREHRHHDRRRADRRRRSRSSWPDPCSAETEEQVEATAAAVKKAGAKVLRGGAFKPRSSPYSFQGLGEEGLQACCAAPPIGTTSSSSPR